MHLTNREKQVVSLLLEGEKQANIADRLNISVWTVNFHLRNVRRKTHNSTTLGVAVFFARLPAEIGS